MQGAPAAARRGCPHAARHPAPASRLLFPTALPSLTAEDEGVVLVVAIQADGTSCMLVLDGASLAELARARLPWRLTTGFHGAFIPA